MENCSLRVAQFARNVPQLHRNNDRTRQMGTDRPSGNLRRIQFQNISAL